MGYFAAVLWYEQQNLGNIEEERYRKVRQNSRVLKNRGIAIVRQKRKYAFAKKRIKVDVPQVSWKEFGVDATR